MISYILYEFLLPNVYALCYDNILKIKIVYVSGQRLIFHLYKCNLTFSDDL